MNQKAYLCGATFFNILLFAAKDGYKEMGKKSTSSNYSFIHGLFSLIGYPGWDIPNEFQDSKSIVDNISKYLTCKTQSTKYIPFIKKELKSNFCKKISTQPELDALAKQIKYFLIGNCKTSEDVIREVTLGLRYLLVNGTSNFDSFTYDSIGKITRQKFKDSEIYKPEYVIISCLEYLFLGDYKNKDGEGFLSCMRRDNVYLPRFAKNESWTNRTVIFEFDRREQAIYDSVDIVNDGVELVDDFYIREPEIHETIKGITFNVNSIVTSGSNNRVNLYVDKQVIVNGVEEDDDE